MNALWKNSTHFKFSRHLRKWHRKLGIVAAFFLIFLSISGIALNHTEEFSLGHIPVSSSLLLDHYGIQAPKQVHHYIVTTRQVLV